jgi:hypothetical protein
MSIKYMYGKMEHLGIFLDGGADVPENRGVRFCDIIHYKTMENEKVRDNESRRIFTLDRERFTIEIGGQVIDSKDMTDHPTVELSVPRCYCLCLSEKKDDSEMFERFNADVCIGVDTDVLIEFLETIVAKRIPIRVMHGNVTYYPTVMRENPPLEEALIFHKEDAFSVEAEYRIALMVPERVHFICDGEKVSVLEGDEPSFL